MDCSCQTFSAFSLSRLGFRFTDVIKVNVRYWLKDFLWQKKKKKEAENEHTVNLKT